MGDQVACWEGLSSQHAKYLADRGVTPEVDAARGYYTATEKGRLKELGFGVAAQAVPALVIPVWAPWPLPDPVLHQVRPDQPRRDATGRVRKFEFPANAGMFLDAHPSMRPLVGNPEVPLLVTEGIVKADAAVSHMGVCTVGLAGVWNWRGRNDDKGLVALADWEFVHLADRDVVIAFDSDVMVKPSVHDALGRLGAMLTRRGARVQYAYLSAGDGGAKIGLDDWIVSRLGTLGLEPAPGRLWVDLLDLCESGPKRPGQPRLQPQAPPDPDSVRPLDVLLDDVARELERYVVFNETAMTDRARRLADYQVVAVTLFVVLTFIFAHFDTVPYLHVLSPTKRSGKTRLLEVLQRLCCRAWLVAEVTEATLFRKIEAEHPCVLIDEVDALWSKAGETTQGVRAILNVGFRADGTVPRAVPSEGRDFLVKDFSVFSPKVLAGISVDRVPDTVKDRCIPIRLERRSKGQRTPERFRLRHAKIILGSLASELADWSVLHGEQLANDEPALPEALNDRAQDIWEPLLAIADRAGGNWPTLAREAALVLHGADETEDTGELLLRHIRDAFADVGVDTASGRVITTERLLQHLVGRGDDSPWARWWAKDVDGDELKGPASRLARLLRSHSVQPRQLKVEGQNVRGYRETDFAASWERYLRDPVSDEVAASLPTRSEAVSIEPETPTDQGGSEVASVPTNGTGPVAAEMLPDVADDRWVEF